MSHPIAFVESLAEVTLRPNGVTVFAQSGDEVFGFRADVSLWREFLAREVGRLNEFDAAQRTRVVPIRGRKPAH